MFCYSAITAGGLAFTVRLSATQRSTYILVKSRLTLYSFQASEIGYSLAISGAASGGLQLFFMPYLLRRFDHAKMYNFCMAIWPYCYVFLPGLNLIARMGRLDEAGLVDPTTKALLWIGIGFILLLARSAGLAFS